MSLKRFFFFNFSIPEINNTSSPWIDPVRWTTHFPKGDAVTGFIDSRRQRTLCQDHPRPPTTTNTAPPLQPSSFVSRPISCGNPAGVGINGHSVRHCFFAIGESGKYISTCAAVYFLVVGGWVDSKSIWWKCGINFSDWDLHFSVIPRD